MDDLGVPVTPETVRQSVVLALSEMPRAVAHSPAAMAALELATSIDQGPETYRFQAALVKELRDTVSALRREANELGESGDDVDDLAARRVARRAAAGASEPSASG